MHSDGGGGGDGDDYTLGFSAIFVLAATTKTTLHNKNIKFAFYLRCEPKTRSHTQKQAASNCKFQQT